MGKDLSEFMWNRGGKVVDKCLAVALDMSTAEKEGNEGQKLCSWL